jgi:hypothetical protein
MNIIANMTDRFLVAILVVVLQSFKGQLFS